MPSIDFEIWCGNCGAGLCGDTDVDGTSLTVTCDGCITKTEAEEEIKEARSEGYDKGYEEGYQQAEEDLSE